VRLVKSFNYISKINCIFYSSFSRRWKKRYIQTDRRTWLYRLGSCCWSRL